MTGTQIIKQGRGILEAAGWVTMTMNSNRYTPRGMRGFPDIVAFRHGMTILIEVKGDGDRKKPTQQEFFEAVKPHLGMTLRWYLVHDIEQIEDIVMMRMP